MRIPVTALVFGLALGFGASAQPPAPTARLIELHDALHLSPDQEPAWNDYTAAIAPSSEAIARHQATDQLLPLLPTPRRIALIDAALTRDLADFRRQGAAAKVFYDRLTPDQQMTFDRQTLPAGGPDGPAESPRRP